MTPLEEPVMHATALSPEALPLGEPLAWPVVDHDGRLLMERGSILVGEPERRFLFAHFQPQRGDFEAPVTASAEADDPAPATEPGARDMHLALGALMGLRTQIGGSGAPVQPCRLIGMAPNNMLFVTPPVVDGRKATLIQGENVEVIAVASQAVFRFVSSVEAICQSPVECLVLSEPAAIRRLRERKSIRVRARIPVRYRLAETGDGYDGIALARGISTFGLSICAPWVLGKVGERIAIAFELRSGAVDTAITTSAIIRNVQHEAGPDSQATLGLELDRLTAAEQMAMKSYVFDRQDDVLYWTDSER
ncbi:flagellar brake protein [Paraburkholderia adhaesiva]|uniref:flagellar brake protein n=1 Tax=Paraburkholderia adhaesiva TaxID=2883244 RepID=UPI001F1EDEDD|nr:flagellar brake protein [Paraburkholderia adhaesiva]